MVKVRVRVKVKVKVRMENIGPGVLEVDRVS